MRGVVGRDVHEQPVARAARLGAASTALTTLNVARSTRPACAPAASHTRLVLARRRRARASDDDELAAAVRRSRRPASTVTCASSMRKRRRLPHLPADELVEILAPAPAPSRTARATPWRRVSGTTSATRRGRPPSRSSTRRSASATTRRGRGCSARSAPATTAPGGQRLDGVRARRRAPPLRAPSAIGRHAPRRDLDGRPAGRAWRRERRAVLIRRTSPC